MVNTSELSSLIADSGLKKQHIAKELGISVPAFWRKVQGVSDFKSLEIVKLCDLLNIKSSVDKDRLFLRR